MCRAGVHSPCNIQDRNDKAERRLQIIFAGLAPKFYTVPPAALELSSSLFGSIQTAFMGVEICKAFSGCPQCLVPQVGSGRAGDRTEHPPLGAPLCPQTSHGPIRRQNLSGGFVKQG